MKIYPHGCSPATGESASLVINFLPGEFDPVLSCPFKLIFRSNIINLSETGDTWTKIVDPNDNQNSAYYVRPSKRMEHEHMFPRPDPTQPTLQKHLPIHHE